MKRFWVNGPESPLQLGLSCRWRSLDLSAKSAECCIPSPEMRNPQKVECTPAVLKLISTEVNWVILLQRLEALLQTFPGRNLDFGHFPAFSVGDAPDSGSTGAAEERMAAWAAMTAAGSTATVLRNPRREQLTLFPRRSACSPAGRVGSFRASLFIGRVCRGQPAPDNEGTSRLIRRTPGNMELARRI